MNRKDYNWLNAYTEYLSGKTVLELGGGFGDDSVVIEPLCQHLCIIEQDNYGAEILEQRVPKATVLCVDFREILTKFKEKFDTIIASLSIHYFNEDDTKQVLTDIANVMHKDSTLIVRVNSSKDVNYGAKDFPKIEDEYFNINGYPKRFFSKKGIEYFFNKDWELSNISEKSIDRYLLEKIVWEFTAKKKINY